MSRNKNRQNKEKTVTDTTDNTTNDLTSDLNDLGNQLKAAIAETVSTDVEQTTTAVERPVIAQQEPTNPVVTPPEAPAQVTHPNTQITDILTAAATAAAAVVEENSPVTDFETPVKVQAERVGDTPRTRIQKSIIDTYVEVTAPGKPINWDVMTNHHIKLCKALIESAGYPYIEFKEVYDHLLKQVKEHRAKAFSDLYVRRFDDRLYPKMTKDQIAIADRLISIITTVGRHNDRSRALQQIDLAASLKDVKPAVAQQNLSAYFGGFRR